MVHLIDGIQSQILHSFVIENPSSALRSAFLVRSHRTYQEYIPDFHDKWYHLPGDIMHYHHPFNHKYYRSFEYLQVILQLNI